MGSHADMPSERDKASGFRYSIATLLVVIASCAAGEVGGSGIYAANDGKAPH